MFLIHVMTLVQERSVPYGERGLLVLHVDMEGTVVTYFKIVVEGPTKISTIVASKKDPRV
jgi:hypothetical protein